MEKEKNTSFNITRELFKQLKDDLFGKDSHRGLKLTYSWLANQFGHFSLGFVTTLIVITLFNSSSDLGIIDSSIWSLFIVAGLWAAFEFFNVVIPLKSEYADVKIFKTKRYLGPDISQILKDVFTDLSFFWFGGIFSTLFPLWLAGIKMGGIFSLLIIGNIVFLIIILRISRYWYKARFYQQNANYPFQLMLGQWEMQKKENQANDLGIEQKENGIGIDIERFINSEKPIHMLIYGGKRSGKTSLAVGIGTKESFNHKKCYYTTAVRFIDLLNNPNIVDNPNFIWSWKEADLLIVDDLNSAELQIISPDLIKKQIENNIEKETKRGFANISKHNASEPTTKTENFENLPPNVKTILSSIKTIWVIGNRSILGDDEIWRSFISKTISPKSKNEEEITNDEILEISLVEDAYDQNKDGFSFFSKVINSFYKLIGVEK